MSIVAVIANTISMNSIRKKIVVVRRGAVPLNVEGVDVSAVFNDYLK